MANIYDIDFNQMANDLLPPTKRLTRIKALLACVLYPLQWIRDLFLGDYKEGSNYLAYDGTTLYSQYISRVIYTDGQVYECTNDCIGILPTDTNYWKVVNNNFIGANERVKYNSQIILFEYHLNKWFQNPLPAHQIYIANQNISNQMVMGNTSAYSSNIANDSIMSSTYMGNTYTPVQYNFIIYFPIALFNALPPSTNPDKVKMIRNYVDKYRLSGMIYTIITY